RCSIQRCPDPFELLRTLVPPGAVAAVPGLPFAGGAIGFLGYGLRHAVEPLADIPRDPLGQPDLWLGLYDRAVVFDHRDRQVLLLALRTGAGPERVRDAETRLRALRVQLEEARGREPVRPARSPRRRAASLMTSRGDYLARIERALAHIARGDLYQVNLSHRIDCPYDEDPRALFRSLCERNPAPFAAYLDADPFQVLSASPERFVALQGDRATCSPIKGTRRRGALREEDEELARDLAASAKDRAENVMIADLVRNDLG